LLSLAQTLGKSTHAPDQLPPSLTTAFDQAEDQLTLALEISDAAGLARSQGIRKRLSELRAGHLTTFP
jgi:hypothetical protein